MRDNPIDLMRYSYTLVVETTSQFVQLLICQWEGSVGDSADKIHQGYTVLPDKNQVRYSHPSKSVSRDIMSRINAVFYSNRDAASKQLLNMMQIEGLDRYFHMFCVEEIKTVPPEIRSTPTLLIKNVQRMYIGHDAFSWVARIIQHKRDRAMHKMDSKEKSTALLGFSDLEMRTDSDLFSFFNQNQAKESTESLPQSYFPCVNLGVQQIITPPLENGTFRVRKGPIALTASQTADLQVKLVQERKLQDDETKAHYSVQSKRKN